MKARPAEHLSRYITNGERVQQKLTMYWSPRAEVLRTWLMGCGNGYWCRPCAWAMFKAFLRAGENMTPERMRLIAACLRMVPVCLAVLWLVGIVVFG